jgi:iron complex outermembrane receptor protein
MRRFIWVILSVSYLSGLLWSIDDPYLEMSLEELFSTNIVISASKRPEVLFEAPMDISVIRKEEIRNSGANSIPEALKLIPGIIVREQTPGNYDVQIRGFDTATTSLMVPTPNCSIILVMIDDRIVYDYFAGGTFWEMLGIDIEDVEKIEVVRGPASALYGPNAMTGVIHIITNTYREEGFHLFSKINANHVNSRDAYMRMDYRHLEKYEFTFSTNVSQQYRTDELYFSTVTDQYHEVDELSTILLHSPEMSALDFYGISYKDQNLSLENNAINLSAKYNIDEKNYFKFDLGFQKSRSQKAYYNNFFTPLSQYKSKGIYQNFQMFYDNLYLQQNYNMGYYDNNFYWSKYAYVNYNLSVEYPLYLGKSIIRPGYHSRSSQYASRLFTNELFDTSHDIPNQMETIASNSVSLLFDYPVNQKWRIVSGFRSEKYNIKNQLSNSFEAGITYRADKDKLFRIMISGAERSPFMIDAFSNKASLMFLDPVITQIDTLVGVIFYGNKTLPFLRNYTLDIGYRLKLSEKSSIDANLFYTVLDQFSDYNSQGYYLDTISYGTPVFIIPFYLTEVKSLKVNQKGLNYTINYELSDKTKLKTYGMIQFTNESLKENGFEYLDFLADSTPLFSAGYTLNINPLSRFNVFTQHNYYSKQKFNFSSLAILSKTTIKAYHNININLIYEIDDKQSISLYLKNLEGKHREYPFTDQIYFNAIMGYTFKF